MSDGPPAWPGRAVAALRRLVLCAGLLSVSACMGHDIEAIRAAEPAAGSAFSQALTAEYRAIALFEADRMYDWIDAGHFARKGLDAAAGTEVGPEPLENWRIPPVLQGELAAARARLTDALDGNGRRTAPQLAAQAQGSFDCWVEQQEENHQPEDIGACRDAYYSRIEELSAVLQAEAGPEPATVPPPVVPDIETRVPFAVVLFAFDSADLDGRARAAADRVAQEAARRSGATLTVIGHADRRGRDDYNLALSQRRAERVRDDLVARGVAPGRIAVVGRGEWEPAVATADGVAEPANRRVEVYFKDAGDAAPAISERAIRPVPHALNGVGSRDPSMTAAAADGPETRHGVAHRTALGVFDGGFPWRVEVRQVAAHNDGGGPPPPRAVPQRHGRQPGRRASAPPPHAPFAGTATPVLPAAGDRGGLNREILLYLLLKELSYLNT